MQRFKIYLDLYLFIFKIFIFLFTGLFLFVVHVGKSTLFRFDIFKCNLFDYNPFENLFIYITLCLCYGKFWPNLKKMHERTATIQNRDHTKKNTDLIWLKNKTNTVAFPKVTLKHLLIPPANKLSSLSLTQTRCHQTYKTKYANKSHTFRVSERSNFWEIHLLQPEPQVELSTIELERFKLFFFSSPQRAS